jgi:hypothetical protein
MQKVTESMFVPNPNTTSLQKAPALEWQVCEDDAAWDAAQHALSSIPVRATPARMHQFWRRYRMHALVVVLLVAFGSGWWVWQRAEAGIAQVEAEVQAEIVAELWQGDYSSLHAETAGSKAFDKLALPADPGEIITQVDIHELGEDWAVVDVTIQPAADGPSYRQTRLYREDIHGWVREEPAAARWGQPQQLENQYVTFVYHDLDEAAVKEAAPQIDALYPPLYRDLFGTLPAHQKLTITLNPSPTPWLVEQDGSSQTRIVLSSPAGMLLPSDLNAGDMLVQSLVLALFDRQTIDSFPTRIRYSEWPRLHIALRLWFIWEHDLPLAKWRAPLVQWVFEDGGEARDPHAVPTFASKLCAHHALWMPTPLDIHVPLQCWQDQEGQVSFSAWRTYEPATKVTLNTLFYRTNANMDDFTNNYGVSLPEPGPSAIMLATIFEYVTARDGASMMPLLLNTIPEHDYAETLIPAVFGVPLTEFEKGWRAFLVERYALDATLLNRVQ